MINMTPGEQAILDELREIRALLEVIATSSRCLEETYLIDARGANPEIELILRKLNRCASPLPRASDPESPGEK